MTEMTTTKLDSLLELALNATKAAGEAILREQKTLKIWQKPDGSPLSSADLASNEVLCQSLAQSGFKLCSEESPLDFDTRKNLTHFWLIDPLDGTKSFIKGSDEYCILVALIAHKRPILSLIAKPSTSEIYYAHAKSPLFKNASPLKIDYETFAKAQKIALISVHHPNEKNGDFLAKNALTPAKISSALKFVALLEGRAGVYHRFESLHSWDIAAGDFLLNQSGGFMGDLKGKALSYNEKSFLCEHFVAVSKKEFLKNLIF